MTFAELQTAVLARLNMSTDDPAAASVDGLVNEGIHMVEIAHPGGWPWLYAAETVSVAAGANGITSLGSNLTLGVEIVRILSVSIANSTAGVLDPISPSEGWDSGVAPTTGYPVSGIPTGWWVEGSTLWLSPTPVAATSFLVRAILAEPDLTQDGESPILPVIYHGAIVSAALVTYYETLQDVARAEAAARRFDGWIARMMVHNRQMGPLPRVRLRA